ncbi:hypothetical protein RA274_27835, partial [Pseudomonas syringae pv. tagetis]|uniref:hypothetical protein n=1 Tax=Pseudomonas syringae group genomosp. 7 TaxID=251699 RepID=UPI00376FD49C
GVVGVVGVVFGLVFVGVFGGGVVVGCVFVGVVLGGGVALVVVVVFGLGGVGLGVVLGVGGALVEGWVGVVLLWLGVVFAKIVLSWPLLGDLASQVAF